jgi:tetratricopeptide (TPR) repeat protein
MRWIPSVLLCIVLGVHADTGLSQELDNPLLGKAEALVRAGKAGEAWQLLSPLEAQYAGQPDFDYLLGIAALESARPNRATFILERVITVNPGHLAARLEMARAYFALGDFERAEREFNLILKASPPAGTRSLIQSYLARMRDPAQVQGPGFSGYAEIALGHDTNVAAAAAQTSVFIPGLNTEFVPDSMFQRRPDRFTSLGAGLEYAHPLRADLGVVAGADFRQRWHSDIFAFDSRVVDLQATLIHRLDERERMHYTVRHNRYELDNSRYQNILSLAAQWTRGLSPRTSVSLSAQGYRIRYLNEDAQSNSSNLVAAAGSATHVLQESSRTVLAGGLYAGHDNAVAGRVDGDRRMLGVSLGAQRRLFSRVHGYVRYAVLESDYATTNPDFGETRRDRQHDGAVGLVWEMGEGWSLRPQMTRTRNLSNLPLNAYSRTESSITLRRAWD